MGVTMAHADFDWNPSRLGEIDARFRDRPPEALLRWARSRFEPDICLATSFGPQTIVLMHMLARLRAKTTIFYLDTDLLFAETYALRDELAGRLGLRFTRVEASLPLHAQEAIYGEALWAREPERCCYLRKVLPLQRFLADKRAWITGVRRTHTAERNGTRLVEWDSSNALVKINPLARWTDEEVWTYIRRYDLPSNPLHSDGYPSIGCRPCTRPVEPGQAARSGRWAGTGRDECGIHRDRIGPARAGHPGLPVRGTTPGESR
jgi:phosphoadenosine phosphosulfate reductase